MELTPTGKIEQRSDKAIVYIRVSTEEQTEQNQVAVLEKWAFDRGWEIVGKYCEMGSAWQHADQKELKKRPRSEARLSTKLNFIFLIISARTVSS